MTKIVAVIGSMFGDEGKGLMTDYYARQLPGAFVIRFSGGAQAGHTVVTPQGDRHVFSHIGAGTLAGSPTYLGEDFIVNPWLFEKEINEFNLASRFPTPRVYVHPRCIVTTPYDMLINQIFEEQRGDGKHGSTGVGIGETVQRTDTAVALRVSDLVKSDEFLLSMLNYIRTDYVPTRVKLDDRYQGIVDNPNIPLKWLQSVRRMLKEVMIADYNILKEYNRDLIFEGAQGLMLDPEYGYFPHVTRANCGLQNVAAILNQLGLRNGDITANYLSRIYTTRHGAGPLHHERSVPYNVYDKTNVFNKYQESLRFAPLDVSLLVRNIERDMTYLPEAKIEITMTHVDSLVDSGMFVENGTLVKYNRKAAHERIQHGVSYVSYGPTARDVRRVST